MEDPLIYRILAAANLAVYGSFFLAYAFVVLRGKNRGTLWQRIRSIEVFAQGLLVFTAAVLIYQVVVFAKQFFGEEYWGRDQFRVTASALLTLAGLIMNFVLWRINRKIAK